MKIAIATAMHGRHEVVKKFAANAKANGCDVYCAYTLKADGDLARELGFNVVEAPNELIHAKHQAAVNMAYKKGGYDALLLMGSDDEIYGLEHYKKALKKYEVCAVMDCFFHELGTGRKLHWQGYENYRKGEPVGAGRCIRWDVLKELGGKVWNDDTTNRGHDRDLWLTIEAECTYKIFTSEHVQLIDWKDKDSSSPFAMMQQYCKKI